MQLLELKIALKIVIFCRNYVYYYLFYLFDFLMEI